MFKYFYSLKFVLFSVLCGTMLRHLLIIVSLNCLRVPRHQQYFASFISIWWLLPHDRLMKFINWFI
jgi:hypothetical protein